MPCRRRPRRRILAGAGFQNLASSRPQQNRAVPRPTAGPDTHDLRVFRAVVREGSMTRAAALLGYVQSNVTARIQHSLITRSWPSSGRFRRNWFSSPSRPSPICAKLSSSRCC
ncbi:LysR family transcriptional regulator [Paenibacillus hodogayensis]|uniref:LysR family transcriptional regulator n=1 Tax=Paenibacillus hodogayensis TaxID=279208 RepID=A0ABV5W2X1_9BACL